MNSIKVILATVVIFACGVITGGLLVFHTQSKSPVPLDSAAAIPAPWVLQRFEFLRRLRGELDLSEAQDKRIQQIILDGQERLRPLWEQVNPQLQDELRIVRQQIAAQLSPAQQTRFDRLLRARPNRSSDQLPAMEDRRQRRLLLPGGGSRPIPAQMLPSGTNALPPATDAPGVN